jgi:type IV pilus assembly protein PilA
MQISRRGFSLIELLIVVAIILIVAAIAIPDLLKSKNAANQASAVGSLKIIISAETSYNSTYTLGYSSTLAQLDGNANPPTSASAGLLDNILGSGTKSGYNFYYVPCVNPGLPNNGSLAPGVCIGNIDIFQISANPINGAANGNYYYTDTSGVIRQNNTAPAGPADTPIAG